MFKFILGIIIGAALAFGYVRFNVQLPSVLQLPDMLRGNLISTATEADLYNLNAAPETHKRALEIFFANRSKDAAKLDADTGHPFLKALYKKRATREARQLSMQWTAYDQALSKPALRESLERKHATSDTAELKRHMLFDALSRKPFLKEWLEKNAEQPTRENLQDLLKKTRRR